jgi:hypothetical protein
MSHFETSFFFLFSLVCKLSLPTIVLDSSSRNNNNNNHHHINTCTGTTTRIMPFDNTEEETKDEEYDRLLVASGDDDIISNSRDDKCATSQQQRNPTACHDSVVGVSFSMQFLATVVLILFLASQATLFRCCRISVQKRNELIERQHFRHQNHDPTFLRNATVPVLRKYSLNIKSTTIWSSMSSKASKVHQVYQGDDIVVQEDMSYSSKFEDQPVLRVIRPYLGFVEQRPRNKPIVRSNVTVRPNIFEPLPPHQQPRVGEFTTNSMCPLIYSSWQEASKETSKMLYASPTLVVAQQFWNGMQVVLLLLMIVVLFKFSSDVVEQQQAANARGKDVLSSNSTSLESNNNDNDNDSNNNNAKKSSEKFQTWRILPLALLPVMMYLVNPNPTVLSVLFMVPLSALLIWVMFGMSRQEDDRQVFDLNEQQAESSASFQSYPAMMAHHRMVVWRVVSTPTCHLWAARCLGLVTVCLLPFSSYVGSPGGHCFAFLTAIWIALAFGSPKFHLRLSIGETEFLESAARNDNNFAFSPPRTICFEETLGFLCTLGSSLYNFAGHTYVWPHWKQQFHKIDQYMGWPSSGDVTWEENWTVWGLFAERSVLPPFVPRGNGGSTAGAQQFWLVWSVLPFLYCCYFGCMIILSQKTPNVFSRWFQRLACMFGILHFLFGTDVVHYRYGRGYRNPYSELFHWTEKW